jgi:hypothetical protein
MSAKQQQAGGEAIADGNKSRSQNHRIAKQSFYRWSDDACHSTVDDSRVPLLLSRWMEEGREDQPWNTLIITSKILGGNQGKLSNAMGISNHVSDGSCEQAAKDAFQRERDTWSVLARCASND